MMPASGMHTTFSSEADTSIGIPSMATLTDTEILRAGSPRIDWRLLWSGGEDLTVTRMLGVGAVVWAIYSLVQLLVNGIILDETVMPAQIIAGAVVRALGAALIWPAATAWIAESMPRRRHAFYMGLFGEFENFGVTVGPVLGGLAWSVAGIQTAFYIYAVGALLAAAVAAVMVDSRRTIPATDTIAD